MKQLLNTAILGFLLTLFISVTTARANKAERQVNQWIKRAHKAFATREFQRTLDTLNKADKMLRRVQQKMRPRIRDNARLWLAYLRARTHQLMGLLPPMDTIEAFETPKALRHQLQQLLLSLRHLEEAVVHLKQYQSLYRNIAKKHRLRDAMILLASNNRVKVLENRIQLVKLRVFRLKMALRMRKLEGNQSKLTEIKQTLRTQSKALAGLRRKQLALAKQRKQRSLAYRKQQQGFLKKDKQLQGNYWKSNVLLWTGGTAVIVGAVGIIVGGYYLADPRHTADLPCNAGVGNSNVVCLNTFGSILGVSVALAVAGATGIIVGAAIRPSQQRFYQNVLESHKPRAQDARDAATMGRW